MKGEAMKRRAFLGSLGAAALPGALSVNSAEARIPAHNWDGYSFGSGPRAEPRLYQGPFPQYAPEEFLQGSDVVMATTLSSEIVPNFGMGLVVYVSGDLGPPRIPGETLEKSIEDLVKIPFVQKIYLRPDWRDIQKRPGRLDFPEYWKITFDLARRYGKRVGFRIMLENPDVPGIGVPDFLADRVPYVKLPGTWSGDSSRVRYRKEHRLPRYDDPAYQSAYRELNGLLASELDGNELVEYMDTFMYGFWGEGHSWPFEGHPFPDDRTAEETFVKMFEVQREHWRRTPLVTNTQPDFSRVGNSELVDRTVRGNDWLRTDTIFIENTQIETLANRPPWIAAVSEVGMTTGEPEKLRIDEGVTYTENIISHVIDLGANYWSVWNWHNIAAGNILGYYERFPAPIDRIARSVGYRVRPSWIWSCEKDGYPGLVVGFVNDGIACVPGSVRVSVVSPQGQELVSGFLDPGYPQTRGVRQAMLPLPEGTDWRGLRLKGELEVKGVRHPLSWACRQKTEPDGSLILRPTAGL
jgi:hypothetical protein